MFYGPFWPFFLLIVVCSFQLILVLSASSVLVIVCCHYLEVAHSFRSSNSNKNVLSLHVAIFGPSIHLAGNVTMTLKYPSVACSVVQRCRMQLALSSFVASTRW